MGRFDLALPSAGFAPQNIEHFGISPLKKKKKKVIQLFIVILFEV